MIVNNYETVKILVVEDDECVRNFTTRVLQKSGYQVYEAANSRAATFLLESEKLKPDMMITDVILPEMNGYDLAVNVKAQIPEIAVIFFSGYSFNYLVEKGTLDNSVHFIQKPFTVINLISKVKNLLHQN